MRGIDHQQSQMFSYLSPETRVRKDHPLRTIRVMVDEILAQLSRRFDSMYASAGRPSIPPEKLLRAQLLQMLYSIRSERLLMEEIDYSVLFRWFVGLNLDEEVWNATGSVGEREELSTQGCEERRSARRSRQCDGGLPRGEAVESDACIEDGPGCEDGPQRQGQGSEAELQRESAGGEPPRADRGQ